MNDLTFALLSAVECGVKTGCTEYIVVVDRNADTTFTIQPEVAEEPVKIAELIFTELKLDPSHVAKVYYHKMNGMEYMVIGVLTSQEVVDTVIEPVD